jgi:hypothetical protein
MPIPREDVRSLALITVDGETLLSVSTKDASPMYRLTQAQVELLAYLSARAVWLRSKA